MNFKLEFHIFLNESQIHLIFLKLKLLLIQYKFFFIII